MKKIKIMVIGLTVALASCISQQSKSQNMPKFDELQRILAVPILPREATQYQKDFVAVLKQTAANPNISYGGFITKNTIVNLISSSSGIKFSFCWDNTKLHLFAALQKTPMPIPVDPNLPPNTDDPGAGPYYTSLNFFPNNKGNVNLMSFLPLTDNIVKIPANADDVAVLHYSNIPLRNKDDDATSYNQVQIQSYRQAFRRDFQGNNATQYTETYYSHDEIDRLIAPPDCIGIRYYFGYVDSNTNNKFRIILVAVDSNGNDIFVYHDPAYPADIAKFRSDNRIYEKSWP